MTTKKHRVMQVVVVVVTLQEKSIRIGIEGCKLLLKCHHHNLKVPLPIQKILISTALIMKLLID